MSTGDNDNFNRYAGKPFLVWVDSFILNTIGHLDPEMALKLAKATPRLREAYGSDGSWEEIVMEQLDFDPSVRDAIRTLWEENQQRARAQGGALAPMQFVELFVAENIMQPDDE
jgi:hypothetical protein